MNIKLSVIALGISLAYGATAAMAANTATVNQTGMQNVATIEQFANDDTSATITAFGSYNDASINQQGNDNVAATITAFGNMNDAVVVQTNVENSAATIFQAGDAGDATITQTGGHGGHPYYRGRGNGNHNGHGGHGGGDNQQATINQYWGWGNVAWITQTGDDVDALINQSGFRNKAGIVQDGSGRDDLTASITQHGMLNDGYIKQDGHSLVATVNQSGGPAGPFADYPRKCAQGMGTAGVDQTPV